jgi:hypothetical protein
MMMVMMDTSIPNLLMIANHNVIVCAPAEHRNPWDRPKYIVALYIYISTCTQKIRRNATEK